MQLAQHTVYVTGAASGIGEAIVLRFLAEGAFVALVDRDDEKLDGVLAGLSKPDRTRTLKYAIAESGIRVNAIAPGGVDTPLIRATTCATPEGRQMIESLHPVKRLARADEIASAALFLASDQASFVTGSVMAVDGGWTTW